MKKLLFILLIFSLWGEAQTRDVGPFAAPVPTVMLDPVASYAGNYINIGAEVTTDSIVVYYTGNDPQIKYRIAALDISRYDKSHQWFILCAAENVATVHYAGLTHRAWNGNYSSGIGDVTAQAGHTREVLFGSTLGRRRLTVIHAFSADSMDVKIHTPVAGADYHYASANNINIRSGYVYNSYTASATAGDLVYNRIYGTYPARSALIVVTGNQFTTDPGESEPLNGRLFWGANGVYANIQPFIYFFSGYEWAATKVLPWVNPGTDGIVRSYYFLYD